MASTRSPSTIILPWRLILSQQSLWIWQLNAGTCTGTLVKQCHMTSQTQTVLPTKMLHLKVQWRSLNIILYLQGCTDARVLEWSLILMNKNSTETEPWPRQWAKMDADPTGLRRSNGSSGAAEWVRDDIEMLGERQCFSYETSWFGS